MRAFPECGVYSPGNYGQPEYVAAELETGLGYG